jgi:secreted trypsin-like serine protease
MLMGACATRSDDLLSGSVSIVNGDSANRREKLARSVVALVAIQDGSEALCTGTILNDQSVLTAAHCIASPQEMLVVFGPNVKSAAPDKRRKVLSYKRHPTADLAIVHFTGGLPDGYSPVTLMNSGHSVRAGSEVLMMGYGVTDGLRHKGAGVLRETRSLVLNFTSNAIVTDGRQSSVCFGDSGGPAFVQSEGGEWSQVGVAHAVSDQACDQASIHTRVFPYEAWIRESSEGF